MRARVRFLLELLKATGDRWTDVEGARLGAAFSFYAIFAVFPLILLAVTVIGFVIGDDAPARARLLEAIASDPSARDVVDSTLEAMQRSRGARGTSLAVAVGTLFFSASGAFVELDNALNRIWDVPPRRGTGVWGTVRAWLHDRAAGMAIVVGIGLSLFASLVGSSVLGAIARTAETRFTPALLQTAELALSIALLSAVFTAAFHLVPRTRPPLADVVGGAVLTTALLTILKSLFASYLAHLTSYSAYGLVGGVLALATWIYLSSQIIFFGASLTRVHCEKRGCRTTRAPAPPPEHGLPDRGVEPRGPRTAPSGAAPTR